MITLTTKTFEAKKLRQIRNFFGFTQSEMAGLISEGVGRKILYKDVSMFESDYAKNRNTQIKKDINRWVIENYNLPKVCLNIAGEI